MSLDALHLEWCCDDNIVPDRSPNHHLYPIDVVDAVHRHRPEFRWPIGERKNICSQICMCQVPVKRDNKHF